MNAATGSLVRSSRVMAVGTVASRGTGFLRVAVIGAAIGARGVGDTYNIANVLPNIVYELLLGGVLSSVVVPLLVQAARGDADGGEAYAQRLLTLVALTLGATSLAAVLAAPLIMGVYGRFDPAQRDLAVTFARFFLPQILFYGVGATMGAILNTRGRFAAPMWAPVTNNVVVIGAALVFFALPGPATNELLTGAQILTLAVGTTAGIVVQTVALMPALRRSGFRWRPRFDFRGAGLQPAGRLAGWVVVYVLVNQAAYLVIVNLATAASRAANRVGGGAAAGYSPYFYAFTLFSLPHAVVAVSVITALLPQMSRHAIDDRLDHLRADLAAGLRLSGVVLVPASLAYLALGPLVGTLVFDHGRIGPADARQIGAVLAAFAVGLVPFSAFQLSLRAFYAQRDTRTPALVNVAVNAVNVGVDLLLYAVLPPEDRVIGLALGYAASYAVGFALTSRVLGRRLPAPAEPQHVLRTYLRLLVAALPATALALAVAATLTSLAGPDAAGTAVALAVALPLGAVAYIAVALRLRVEEVALLAGAARRRLHRPVPR